MWIKVDHGQGSAALHDAYIQLVSHELNHTCVKCGFVPPHGPDAPPFWQAFEKHQCVALSCRHFAEHFDDV